jgi:hypothetical protein
VGVAEGIGNSGNFVPFMLGSVGFNTISNIPAKATGVALGLAKPLQQEIQFLVIETSLRDFNRNLSSGLVLQEQFVAGGRLRRFAARMPFFRERLTTVRARSSNPLVGILDDGDAIVRGTGLIRRGNRFFSVATRVQEVDTFFSGLGRSKFIPRGLGFGVDALVSGGIEFYTLWDDPYYDFKQKLLRSGVRGTTNAVGSLAGATIAVWFAGSACASPLAPACIGIGLLGGAVGAFTFDTIFTEPFSRFIVGPRERKLQPLNN